MPRSPARKGENMRAIGAMGVPKLEKLVVEMQPYREADPDAWAKVVAACKKKGVAVPEFAAELTPAPVMDLKPMLAQNAKEKPPRVPRHLGPVAVEPKFDGYRAIFERTESGVKGIQGRNGTPLEYAVDGIEAALEPLPVGTLLDGELFALPAGTDIGSVLAGTVPGTANLAVFDVLRVGGWNAMDHPYQERRGVLERMAYKEEMFANDHAMLVPSVTGPFDHLDAVHDGWMDGRLIEGSVAKTLSGLYVPGARSWDFVKVKPQASTEVKVTGWEYGKGASNTEMCGNMKCVLLETGKETSFGYDCTPEEAEQRVGTIHEIRHHGWTRHGKVRHPVPYRWRPDRD